MNCDGQGFHPVTQQRLTERPMHGCPNCCSRCNMDAHRCPGCGENLNHGVDVCLRCRNRKELT